MIVPGQRVRIVEVGPNDAYRNDPRAIGAECTVLDAELSYGDGDWLYLETDHVEFWCFVQCRVEVIE